jgi:hypothetical protein
MSNDVVTVRLSRTQATFLQANLSVLATTTRQAMSRPGLELERHMALGRRATALESTEDAVRSAMMDAPKNSRKNARGGQMLTHPHAQMQVREFGMPSAGATARPAALRYG